METILAIVAGLVTILAAIAKLWLNKKSASGSGENYEQYETENEVLQDEVEKIEEKIDENSDELSENLADTEEKLEETSNEENVDNLIDAFNDSWRK